MRKIFYLILLTTLSVLSCKKEKNEPETNTINGKLNALKTDVKQFEFVIMTTENIQLNNSTYSGSIGNIKVTIGKDPLGKLCFVMPDLASGSYNLTAEIEGKEYNVSFNVQALSPILNPDQYIQNIFNTFTISSTNVSSLVALCDPLMGSGTTSSNFNLLNNYKQMLNDSINNASSSEKARLAKFIEANPDIFTPFENAIQFKDSLNSKLTNINSYPEDEFNAFESGVKQRLVKSAILVSILSMTGYSSFTIPVVGPLISLACFYGAAKYATEIANYACVYLDKKLLPDYSDMMLDGFQKGNIINNFNHNQEYNFAISANYRNLGQQDVNSSSNTIKSLLTTLNDFENIWNKINFFLPNKLTGTQPHFKNITTYSTKKWRIKPDFLSIGNIINSNVSVNSSANSNYLKATFINSTSSPQNFTFSIIYNNSVNGITKNTAFQGIVTGTTAPSTTTVSDIEGNIYSIVTIGTQLWMGENLKTTKFNNGDAIANLVTNSQWSVATQPGWCYYNNDPLNNNPYGKMYNFFTVADTRNVCPTGWHVPSDAEWTTLENHLGSSSIAGGKMKSTGTQYWMSPNTGATNESGFSALPGGARNFGGIFSGVGSDGGCWSSTEFNTNNAIYRTPFHSDASLYNLNDSKNVGIYIRCVKN